MMDIQSVLARCVGASVLALAAVLAGCGGGGGDEALAASASTTTGAATAADAAPEALDARASALAVRKNPTTPVYRVTDLGTFGGTSSAAYAINEIGQVVGTAALAGNGPSHAFLYNGSGLQDLGVLPFSAGDWGPPSSAAHGINNRGQVSGNSEVGDFGTYHAFLYSWGSLQELAIGGSYVDGSDINDRGQIVGTRAEHDQAFVWEDGAFQLLGTLPGGRDSQAHAINYRGQITGVSSKAPSAGQAALPDHAFLYSNGVMRDLGTLGGTMSNGFDINTKGWVTGMSALPGDAVTHAFLHDGKKMRDLGTLGGEISGGSAVNDMGQVVGSSYTTGFENPHAFIWNEGVMYDLNGLLDDSGDAWTLIGAADINGRGQIVGTGMINGQLHGYLLTPVAKEQHKGRWSGREWRLAVTAALNNLRTHCGSAAGAALFPNKCKAL